MAYFTRSSPLLVFAIALGFGFIVGAGLPRAHACSPAEPPLLHLTEVEGDPTEVEKWQAYSEDRVLMDIQVDALRVDDGQFRDNAFWLLVEPAQ